MGNQKSKRTNQRQSKPTDGADKKDPFESEPELIGEQELGMHFKHRTDRGADAYSSTRTRQAIDDKLLQNHKYEIFRNERIKKHFEEAHIEILDVIKFGGNINVYKAKFDHMLVAIKMIDMSRLNNIDRQFQNNDIEMRMRSHFKRIIQIYHVANYDNKLFQVMEYGKKGSMDDIIRDNGPVSERLAMLLFGQILKGITYLHRNNIVHRNLTLDNIIVTKMNIPKLIGFKYAMNYESGELANTYYGTAAYLAPEVLQRQPYYPVPADIWSLGVCLFCMTNDALPFHSTNIDVSHFPLPPNNNFILTSFFNIYFSN